MAIDPMLYKKYNKRDVDVGAGLAQASAHKSSLEGRPKGIAAGLQRGMFMYTKERAILGLIGFVILAIIALVFKLFNK
jgi:predicted lipid-binding transport protein (Tim44 family)